jgi:hypothetical protein
MLNSMFARVLTLGLLVTTGLTVTLSADHAWGTYHWARTSNPFSLKVGDNLTKSFWKTALGTAVNDWDQNNTSPVLRLDAVAGLSPNRNCRPTTGRIEVCNATYGFNGWLGIAQIWITGSHITQATTKVNDSYFNTSTYAQPAWRQFVMCQEVGHNFGLDHQDENFNNANLGSCMDYTNNPESNQHPNTHDFDELWTIYGYHTDNTTTAGATKLPSAAPPAMGQLSFDAPAQWGQLVHASPNGRQEMYELDFGRGNKVITHVFWADPGADAR